MTTPCWTPTWRSVTSEWWFGVLVYAGYLAALWWLNRAGYPSWRFMQ